LLAETDSESVDMETLTPVRVVLESEISACTNNERLNMDEQAKQKKSFERFFTYRWH
jgi:hypothetical protein